MGSLASMEVEIYLQWIQTRSDMDSLIGVDELSDGWVPGRARYLPGRDDLWPLLPHLALALESLCGTTFPDGLPLTLAPEI